MYLAAPAGATAGALGAVGTGGLALCLTALLVFGVKGKGKLALKDNPATICGFLATTSFAAAGKIWANPERIASQGLTGLGVGTGDGPFGNVGLGAVATLLLILILCWEMNPLRGAVLGMIAGIIWPAAGNESVWAMPSELGAAALMMIGG